MKMESAITLSTEAAWRDRFAAPIRRLRRRRIHSKAHAMKSGQIPFAGDASSSYRPQCHHGSVKENVHALGLVIYTSPVELNKLDYRS